MRSFYNYYGFFYLSCPRCMGHRRLRVEHFTPWSGHRGPKLLPQGWLQLFNIYLRNGIRLTCFYYCWMDLGHLAWLPSYGSVWRGCNDDGEGRTVNDGRTASDCRRPTTRYGLTYVLAATANDAAANDAAAANDDAAANGGLSCSCRRTTKILRVNSLKIQ